jgi:hypothetical protein
MAVTTIKRSMLYMRIWERPMIHVGADFGVTVFWRFWERGIRNPGGPDPRPHWGFRQTKRAQNQV